MCGSTGGDWRTDAGCAGCAGSCAAATPTALSVAELNRILSQAAQGLRRAARRERSRWWTARATLGVFRWPGQGHSHISSGRGLALGNGLEQATVPSTYAAISKRSPAAYLSSEGNAFTTPPLARSCRRIQPGRNRLARRPAVRRPVFFALRVRTSYEPCHRGPPPSPLGLAADPGGLPLTERHRGRRHRRNGGWHLRPRPNINDVDQTPDELIAVGWRTRL